MLELSRLVAPGRQSVSTESIGTPLLQKLGVRAGQTALLVGVPATVDELDGFLDFEDRTDVPSLAALELAVACSLGPFDYIHVFESDAGLLETEITSLREAMAPDGMLWVSWPKRASGVATSLTEDVIRAIAIDSGLVDIKVCAVDQVWSGLKLVIPRDQRPKQSYRAGQIRRLT